MFQWLPDFLMLREREGSGEGRETGNVPELTHNT